MNDSAHFLEQQTSRLLEKQKREWDLFLFWMDQSDDDVMTVHKKQEFLDCLSEERNKEERPILLQFPATGSEPHRPRTRSEAS